MNKPAYYRRMFLIAAIWNWNIAIGSALFYKQIFLKLGMPIPESPIWLLMFLGCVFIFGIGYYWVGNRPPPADLDIVMLGIMGKVMVFVLLLFFCFQGQVHPLFVGLGIGDLIFAGLFLEFILSSRRAHDR